MKKEMKALFAEKIKDFRLPRYNELPNVGLYLEQVTKYINGFLTPLGWPEITSSMVSNYVKKGVILPPQKKQYSNDQLGYLIFISFAKSVLTLENIQKLFEIQRSTYSPEEAYNYFCSELENMLFHIAGLNEELGNIGLKNTEEKLVLRSVIIAVSQIMFISNCLEEHK